MKNVVISLFDYSGEMVRPWAAAGFDCWIYDIQHAPAYVAPEPGPDGMRRIGCDLSLPPRPHLLPDFDRVAFVAAFPPCTHLAVSGARWFKGKGLRALEQSIACFATAAEVCERSGAPYLIENPVSTISTYWRAPDHTFHPHEFTAFELADNYTKKTCLWTGGGFVMPSPQVAPGLPKPDNRIHHAPPGPQRADFRSKTPAGFARAVFLANAQKVAAA